MARYVMRDGELRERSTGERMNVPAGPLSVPAVRSDVQPYRSPIDGRLIGSNSERRDDLKRNNCIDARDFPSPTGGKFRNPEFCRKRGLKVSEEFR